MKHHWKYRQLIHTVLGVISGVVTLFATLLILSYLEWKFYLNHVHNVAGLLFMIIC